MVLKITNSYHLELKVDTNISFNRLFVTVKVYPIPDVIYPSKDIVIDKRSLQIPLKFVSKIVSNASQ